MKRISFTALENAAFDEYSRSMAELYESSAESEALDCGFDPGAFSHQARARAEDEAAEQIIARVTSKFGVSRETIELMFLAYINGDLT